MSEIWAQLIKHLRTVWYMHACSLILFNCIYHKKAVLIIFIYVIQRSVSAFISYLSRMYDSGDGSLFLPSLH